MSHSQRELKHAAAQAFLESLDQLEKGLSAPEERRVVNRSQPPIPRSNRRKEAIAPDVESQLWEDAVADIDRFLQERGIMV